MSAGVARFMYATVAVGLLGLAVPAHAQFQQQPVAEPVSGETYRVEGAVGLWAPSTAMSISSESLGIIGSNIDFRNDLGLQNQRFPEFHFELRGGKHKFRFQAIPIRFNQSATLTRDIVFNGQRYRVGLPVTSALDWNGYRLGYEYDFIRRDRFWVGGMIDVKYTDVTATLTSVLADEFAHALAPVPAIGGVGRVYVVPNVSITGEVTGSTLGWLPASLIQDNQGHYVDYNIYGTWNVIKNVGVQVGYRSLDLGYVVNKNRDSGTFKLHGLFFGVVARY